MAREAQACGRLVALAGARAQGQQVLLRGFYGSKQRRPQNQQGNYGEHRP